MRHKCTSRRAVPFGLILGAVLSLTLCLAPAGFAQESIDDLKKQVEELEKKLEKMEKDQEWNTEDIESLSERVDKTELHTATDKISFGVDFRTRGDSIHYNDIRMAPGSLVSQFFSSYPAGFNGGTKTQIQQAMASMAAAGMIPAPNKYDADNDVIFTNRFRLNIMGRLNQHVDFRGRIAAYKVFGDSTGVKFNQGSLGDVTMDGNSTSLPHGDTLRLERAYFVYKNQAGDVPYSFSAGRRPSTDGPPLEYGNYSMVGGSPLATIINWQFDGASLSFGLEQVTGIPGASFKLCYGVSYENDWGNGTSLNYNQADLEDVHMFGFISDLYDNGSTSLMLNYAHAWDITDGFTGLTVMPFTVSKADQLDGTGNPGSDGTDEYYFSQNSGGFISRMEPQTNIGDWDAASLLLRSQIPTPEDRIDWFLAGSWTHTNPTQISKNPFYELMNMGLLSSGNDMQERDGYSVYAGVICPMPFLDARFGLEYNWGSEYWFNFTGAEDSLVGSKLATRGQVYEAYYIQPIYGNNFFLKVGGQFYDYEYTGSGNPLGEPVKISEISALDAVNPVIDEVWNGYLSANLRF
ncbi:MAG: DUF3373 family protein [Thermodesulfobacteriota bacterium]|nr:DUF3373 family protein [Thermodesulfobacteriota bacterium]